MRVRPNGLLLMPAAILVVHQARYTLAYGARANTELAAQGHAYLQSAVPWTILALGIGASMFLRRVTRAARSGESDVSSRVSAPGLWSITTAALIGIYAIQESLEALEVTGHPGGISGVFGHGGWWALPASAVVALGVVTILRLGRAVLRLASQLAAPRVRGRALRLRVPFSVALVAPAPLALAAAGRAPPPPRG